MTKASVAISHTEQNVQRSGVYKLNRACESQS
ncbi:hypothetical protein JI435_423400 [Parastagonospora nodorum SN15]|uniref:Uncharacterized protein n=1 Tax=Phaeosphaeria nodorum (strain SN15 / ATCC MYA-4574 / FGSC 10173) TaxID=321614 RepID=A0A7U2IB14_PHANO|nr:hypothetical protein JI435_423400 [Parastagonospora nodorum SN15]